MTEDATLEQQLARRHRQPAGVEQFGIEPIPEDKKTVAWYDLFVIVLNFLVNPGTVLTAGTAVAAGLPFWGAMVASILGIVIAFGVYVIMATVGVDYGIPGQVATRMAYGLRGSRWLPSVVRTISSVFWFAFQTIAGALAIISVVEQLWGVRLPVQAVSVVFAVFQVLVATVGYGPLKLLSRFAFPLKIVITAYLMYLLITQPAGSYAGLDVFGWAGDIGWQWPLLALWINTVASAWYSMVTDAADFCRYSRGRFDMQFGTMLAAVAGTAIASMLGAYAVAATHAANGNAWDVLARISSPPALLLILVLVVLDNWTINVLNLYTGGLSVSNIFVRLGRFWATLAVSVLGVALSLVPEVINEYSGLMTTMGSIFAPIAGVLIADYVILKKMRLDVGALFDRTGPYWYWHGFNWVAIAWTIAGFGLYNLLPMASVPNLTSLVIVLVGYVVTTRIVARGSTVAAVAARPLDSPVSIRLNERIVERYGS
ncbi:cytosine permease [Nonomuraea sp. B12E4]|uniref:purine-cytosine permease family protein n=1 Tax=Nonomuraea sp. B12E4 TaxID=3153564 RepID=UPI00325F19CD